PEKQGRRSAKIIFFLDATRPGVVDFRFSEKKIYLPRANQCSRSANGEQWENICRVSCKTEDVNRAYLDLDAQKQQQAPHAKHSANWKRVEALEWNGTERINSYMQH
uniref:Uncharacterized protein n=1 Tax=Anopheles atroparvus TaxID=41427 RepID=A0AAG5CNQ7_ANOAO